MFMRTIGPLTALFALFAVVWCLPILSWAVDATLTATIAPASPQAGEQFRVTVSIDNVLGAAPLDVEGGRITLNVEPADKITVLGIDTDNLPAGCPAGGVVYPSATEFFVQKLTGTVAFGFAAGQEGDLLTGNGCMVTFLFELKTPCSGCVITATIDPQSTELLTPGEVPVDLAVGPPTSVTSATMVSGVASLWNNCTPPRPVGQPIPSVRVNVNIHDPLALGFPGIDPPADVTDTDGEYEQTVSADGVTPYRVDGLTRSDNMNHFDPAQPPTDVRLAIDMDDVRKVMMHFVAPETNKLEECPLQLDCMSGGRVFPAKIAADVNRTGRVTSADATILKQLISFRMGANPTFPAYYPTQNWICYCAGAQLFEVPPAGIIFDPVCLLIGDADGDYKNNGHPRKAIPGEQLAIAKVSSQEMRVTVPVEVRNANEINALEAKIVFDPSVLRFVGAKAPDAVGRGDVDLWTSEHNGVLALLIANMTSSYEGTSTIALLEFERVDMSAPRASSPILVSQVNAHDRMLLGINGFFTTATVEESSWGAVKTLYR